MGVSASRSSRKRRHPHPPPRGRGRDLRTTKRNMRRDPPRCSPPPCGEELEVGGVGVTLVEEAPAPPPPARGRGRDLRRTKHNMRRDPPRCSPPPCGEELEVEVWASRSSRKRWHPHPPARGRGQRGATQCRAPLRGPGMTKVQVPYITKSAASRYAGSAPRYWRPRPLLQPQRIRAYEGQGSQRGNAHSALYGAPRREAPDRARKRRLGPVNRGTHGKSRPDAWRLLLPSQNRNGCET